MASRFSARFHDFLNTARTRINPSYVIHFGNGLAVIAMGSSDMLELRTFSMCSSTCGVAYNLLQPKPLWVPVGWGVFFICGQAVQIVRLLLSKTSVTFTEEEHYLYEHAFMPFGFTPKQYSALIKHAPPVRHEFKPGELVVTEGMPVTAIDYVVAGSLGIEHNGQKVNTIKPKFGGICLS
jgi:hypothetical protein